MNWILLVIYIEWCCYSLRRLYLHLNTTYTKHPMKSSDILMWMPESSSWLQTCDTSEWLRTCDASGWLRTCDTSGWLQTCDTSAMETRLHSCLPPRWPFIRRTVREAHMTHITAQAGGSPRHHRPAAGGQGWQAGGSPGAEGGTFVGQMYRWSFCKDPAASIVHKLCCDNYP